MEEFRTINYKGTKVTVSNYGTIILNGKRRDWYYDQDGYVCVSMKIYRDRFENYKPMWVTIRVHIIVARAFVPNPDNLPEVHHIDYNRKNPCADNLRWVTHHENVLLSVCNKPDMSGKNNPNYGNRKLSQRYKEHPELAKKYQSRPGLQNGRCRKIDLLYDGKVIETFPYIGMCCQYLMDKGIARLQKVDSLRGLINSIIRNNKTYKQHYTFVKH